MNVYNVYSHVRVCVLMEGVSACVGGHFYQLFINCVFVTSGGLA